MQARPGIDVIDGDGVAWCSGAEAAAGMTPEFRAHLGPPDAVAAMLEGYHHRVLVDDPRTTRRIDHVRCDPGYVDATSAYHDSVEECLVLDGAVTLSGEGEVGTGEYFWRPAGFVHAARSAPGFEAILMHEGDSPDDASGQTSRTIRPDEEAGRNALHPDDWERAIGPRGWPRRVQTELLPWAPAPGIGVGPEARVRTLSANPVTGATSLLVRAPAGEALLGADPVDAERFVIVAAGEALVDGDTLRPVSVVRIAADVMPPVIAAGSDRTRVLLKRGGRPR